MKVTLVLSTEFGKVWVSIKFLCAKFGSPPPKAPKMRKNCANSMQNPQNWHFSRGECNITDKWFVDIWAFRQNSHPNSAQQKKLHFLFRDESLQNHRQHWLANLLPVWEHRYLENRNLLKLRSLDSSCPFLLSNPRCYDRRARIAFRTSKFCNG